MQDPQSAVLTALYHNKRDEARRLSEGATLNIWEAAALGRDERLAELLDRDPSLANAWSPDGYPPVGLAAFFAGVSTVRLLLDRGAEVGLAARNSMKVQPLHAAVASRNAESVALLLERGADVNARQQVGYTPLMGAASGGRADIAELLLSRGADPSLRSDDGKTAADIAREHSHAELAARLGGWGAGGLGG
jgi:ankyrin repeat protein